MNEHEDLVARLEQGPSYLLLGQKYLRRETGEDPLAAPVSRAMAISADATEIYQLLLKVPTDRKAGALSALSEAAAMLAPPAWLRIVADLPWNGVFSTAVDSVFVRALRNEWRTVQPVASSAFRPSSPRNASRVQAVMLFGGADQPPENQPPTTRLELGARRAEARALAQRLPDELITPRGVLVIEAWDIDDWFSSEDLYGLLHRLGREQAHIFSVSSEALEDEFIAAAIEEGILVPHEEDFATYVEEARNRGRLANRQRLLFGSHRIRHGLELYEVPKDIWNSLISFGQPIDVDLFVPPPAQSEELRYLRFREFLGAKESSSIWSSIADGLAFGRDYETELRKRVNSALSNRGGRKGPLLLVGQAGTGKTTALASLAYSVAKEAQYVVVHIPRRPSRPPFEVIDSFCEWAEEMGIPATLLVWDGMVDPDDYFRLAKFLDSRGRRALIVGSCYPRKDLKNSQDVVKAPASLLGGEMRRFTDHLASLGILIPDRDRELIQKDSTFLSALYRLLPESRGPVTKSLVLELRNAETVLVSAARTSVQYEPQTALAAALYKAGLIDNLEAVLQDAEEDDPSYRNPYERLINIVLVVSRHGQVIPLDLALRVVGRDGVRNLPELLGKIDLIRWLDEPDGNYTLAARNELEARVLLEAERINDEAEIEAIAEALAAIRPDNTAAGGSEVQFAMDLLARIGPQGHQEDRYARHFLRIADAIAQANTAIVTPNPRLALLEINLRREWVKYAQRKHIAGVEERIEILREAEEVVEEALSATLPLRSTIRANLMVEQASVMGTQIFELLRNSENGSAPDQMLTDHIAQLVSRVLQITADSMEISADKYYPVDVVCWVTAEVLQKEAFPQDKAASLLAECISRLLLIDIGDLSPKQEVLYNARFADMAKLAEDDQNTDEKLQKLAEHDEPLAAFMYALRVSGFMRQSPDSAGVQAALDHLRSRPAAMNDRRCLRLALDLFWVSKIGYRFLEGERVTLPLDSSDWGECVDLANRLEQMDELSALRVEFMRALAYFHLGQMGAAYNAFRSAERLSHMFRRRIVNVYLASDPSGKPRRFHPFIRRVDADQRKGMCWVEELAREIPFEPYDFAIADPTPGMALPEAYVSFNLRGPILEPARMPGARRGPNVISRPDKRAKTDDAGTERS